ncbi:hypothetical protein BJ170DRAFT_94388 [Xylariales sp. AK1849]|nr:hypothetical protein BJ170DRAFT_94388 [Xylariales sp. AK1849]
MHSSENSRRSQRRRPELNINTSAPSPTSRRDNALSASPPPRKGNNKPPVSTRALRVQSPPMPSTASTIRDRDFEASFLDNDTPIDFANKENHPGFHAERPRKPNTRDSHDLSLPDRQVTRDSLVTNMLMSLDKFSLGQINTPPTPMSPFGEPVYGSMSMGAEDLAKTVSRQGRMHSAYNSHGHGYTYSSDLDGTDDNASRISSQFSRGRRSNSSSGFQSSLGRINSMRETSSNRVNTMPGSRALHSRGGKTSKSSSTNSFDAGYVQVLSSQRISHGIGGRSSSFDYGLQQRPSLTSSNGTPWNIEFSNTFFADDYEAAPTPTVPGGPRRPTVPASPATPAPPYVPQEPDQRGRTKSIQSKAGSVGRNISQTRQEMSPRLPAADLDSAPAPNVGYEKSKDREPVRGGPNSSAPQTKERPGFFRRVFGGSSRNTTNAPGSSISTPVSSTSVQTTAERQTPKAPQHIASQMKAGSAPPSRDSQHSSQHHVIQKKSSFFRRRKKSVTETPPVPQPPVPAIVSPRAQVPRPMDISFERTLTIEKALPSPVSSLRQVMIPYLKGSNPNTPSGLLPPRLDREAVSPEYDVEDLEADYRRKSRGFSPDYEPSPNATIRTVKSHSALNSRSRESVVTSIPRRSPKIESPRRQPPEVPSERPKLVRDATFFEDNSDTEGDKSNNVLDDGDRVRGTSQLLSPSDTPGLPGGFPTPPSSTPRESPRPSPGYPTYEQVLTIDEGSSMRSEASPSLVLQPNVTREEERGRPDSLGLPIQAQHPPTKTSTSSSNTPNRSVASLPSVKVGTDEPSPNMVGSPLDEPEVTVGEPTEDDRQKAQRIFDGNEDFIQKDRAAAWIGEEGLVRQRTLQAYVELYNFTDKSVLTALREICDRLVLRAETQQIDRILVAFSKRWCDCNTNHGFKALDVIHTMCYSIMLLNTDLHLADIEQKMTRSQFVKNTMTTVKAALADSDPEAFERPSILPGKNAHLSPAEPEARTSIEQERKNWRSSFIPPRAESRLGDHGDHEVDSCGPLIKAPFNGSMRAWESQMEVVLKDIYISIRDERLPLFGAAPEQHPAPQQGGLSVMGMLKRTPSVLSKAPSESPSMSRGRIDGPGRPNAGRWGSKSRSRPRIGTAGFSSSRTSLDDGNSIWSPTVSSATWSRYSLGRTQTSMSQDSFGSSFRTGDYQQSIGFANALSQAIIREDGPVDSARSIMSDEVNGAALLEDESLELTGPPWVKEGVIIHKHHLDGVDKKAKDRNWTEVFAVIQKGQMSLFSFSTKSMRQKARLGRKQAPGGVVGGGNWQENATNLGTFSLRQTLASALPSPGYSRTRPHVWALSLPTGSVHLFQVGTPEITKEFVLTVNYWSARLSTHPLVGGISNIEYGWSDACINNALVTAINDNNSSQIPPRPSSAAAGRTSMHSRNGSRQSSLRSSFDAVGGASTSSRAKLPGDRINISEWSPPAQSLRASNLSEPEQLDTLLTYVKGIEEELQKHNQLRSPMLLAFTPRGSNATKAMANWERKSSYLLREIVKFRTYVDCLGVAESRREEVYGEREVARRAARGEDQELPEQDADRTIRVNEEG